MKSNKSRVIIIVAVILIVLLAIGATFAVLYMTTDLFKSPKTLFYQYMMQNEEIGQVFNFSELETYTQKEETTPHTYSASITFNQTITENTATQDSPMNDLKIIINGKSDPINQNSSSNLNVQYADSNLFTVNTIKNGDLYGILSEEIITKYIAVKNENLKEFATKLGLADEDIELIPDKINANQYDNLFSLTEEQKNNLMNSYKTVLINNISKESYTKQKDVPLLLNNNNINTTTYSVTLTEKQFYNVYKTALETTKNNEVMINIIKEKAKILGCDDSQLDEIVNSFQEGIQKLIDDIKLDEKSDNQAVKIILYTADKMLLKTDIVIYEKTTIGIEYQENNPEKKIVITINRKDSSDNFSIEISKKVADEKIEFLVTMISDVKDQESKIVYKFEKSGNISSNEIKDAISFGINDGTNTYRIDYTNTDNYSDSIDVEKLDSSNSVTLNDYPAEDIQNLVSAIQERTFQVLVEKTNTLKQINQGQDIWILRLIPGAQMFNAANQSINSATNTLEKQAVEAFNSQFMPYSGSDVNGSTVKALLNTIMSNNANFSNDISKQITVEFGQYTGVSDTETINGISNLINTASKYSVSLEYGVEGMVNKIAIKENI